ncbi:MAG: ABC transporter permease [Proteobacteria bacterium]|nr:ABC transporter permease [Pseudomonadota bacterium]
MASKRSFWWWSPLLVLLAWELASQRGWVSPQLLPPLEAVGGAFLSLFSSGDLVRHLGISLLRVILGFSLATLVGVSLGMAMGWFRRWRGFFDPLVEILRPIPPMAWIPLAILWMGIGEASKIYIIFYGAFFPIVINTTLGVKSIDENLLKMARSMNLKGWLLFKEVIFPGSLPAVVTGLRIGLGVGWMCLVAAELIAAESGVGYLIEESKELLRTDRVVLGMLLIGALGILSDWGVRSLEKYVRRWL